MDCELQRTIKKKRISKDKDYDIDLLVSIHDADGLDNPTRYPSIKARIYRVVFWVHPNDAYATDVVAGLPNPAWNIMKHIIKLDQSKNFRFLFVEVLRAGPPGFAPDPGTSTGMTLVGRVRIPLPKVSEQKGGRYGLVRLEGDGYRAEGHISVTLEMIKKEKKKMKEDHYV
ncbi:hypothetical protein MANES_14G113400v8 [Manihot esculenta]|uniref:C2 domain-containing protein n=1 Tax=Manihot esculenta TaxID=3983 RepID=A0A2C9UKF0_MANES|nr:hypothetical protein MANES_14G113400v8 [Manihot esculenta]